MADTVTQRDQATARAGAQPGGYMLSLSLFLSAAVSVAVDLNATHLFNPAWPPHAKFHDAAMLNLLTGVCALALWLLWRPSREPRIAALVGWAVPVIFWSAFYWASFLIPGLSLKAMPDETLPTVSGIEIYPNVVVATIAIGLSTFGLWRRVKAGYPVWHD